MKNRIYLITKIFLVALIFFQIGQMLFYHRNAFLQKYDINYWRDRYDHSQYVLPLSQRSIGDDAFYAYSSYRLVTGHDPTTMHLDKPLAAFYPIGWSIILLESPAYASLFFGVATIVVFYFLAKKILNDDLLALFSVTFFVLDPLYISQLSGTWLDLPQLFFLLCNLLFLSYGLERKEAKYFAASGLALGLFAMTKPPILVLPVTLFEVFIIFVKRKNTNMFVKNLLCLSAFAGIGASLPIIPLLLFGHNPIDILKIHKYMLEYYLSSQVKFSHLAILQTLLTGKFTSPNTFQAVNVKEWTALWPIATLAMLCSIPFIVKNKKNYFPKLLLAIVFTSIILFSLVLSFPRYLLIVLPFIYLLAIYFFANVKRAFQKGFIFPILLLLIIYAFFTSHNYLKPGIDETIERFQHDFSHMYFQDIYYELLTKSDQRNIAQTDFFVTGFNTLHEAGIENIKISIEKLIQSNNDAYAQATFTYQTRDLGDFTQKKKIYLTKENSQWKILWDWGLILDGFKPGYTVEKNIQIGKRGAILSQGKILVSDMPSTLISVNPDKIDKNKEEEMLTKIDNITHLKKAHIRNKYNENHPPDTYIDIATVFRPVPDEAIAQLDMPGVKVSAHASRIYFDKIDSQQIQNTSFDECCSRIYSSTVFHGVDGVEKKYEKQLSGSNGGSIVLLDNNKPVNTLIQKEAKEGEDINIP